MSKLLLHTTERGFREGKQGEMRGRKGRREGGRSEGSIKRAEIQTERQKIHSDLKGSRDKEASLFSLVVNISSVYGITALVKIK